MCPARGCPVAVIIVCVIVSLHFSPIIFAFAFVRSLPAPASPALPPMRRFDIAANTQRRVCRAVMSTIHKRPLHTLARRAVNYEITFISVSYWFFVLMPFSLRSVSPNASENVTQTLHSLPKWKSGTFCFNRWKSEIVSRHLVLSSPAGALPFARSRGENMTPNIESDVIITRFWFASEFSKSGDKRGEHSVVFLIHSFTRFANYNFSFFLLFHSYFQRNPIH